MEKAERNLLRQRAAAAAKPRTQTETLLEVGEELRGERDEHEDCFSGREALALLDALELAEEKLENAVTGSVELFVQKAELTKRAELSEARAANLVDEMATWIETDPDATSLVRTVEGVAYLQEIGLRLRKKFQ